jgi:hypothetical protein
MADLNLGTMQAMFRITSPVGLIELQQRIGREYMSALMDVSVALLRALTPVIAEPPAQKRDPGRRQPA